MHRPRRARWEATVQGATLATVLMAIAGPLAGACCGAVLAGCGRAPAGPGSGQEQAVEMLIANDPETLDPRYATDAVGLRTTRLVHAGLVRLDPDTLAPLPYLARSWRWLDPLTLEVELRGDVRFHSGAPLRAQDVVATLRAFASSAVASRHASVVDAIAEAHEDGDHTVVVRLSRPHATLLTDLELPILRADQAASPPAPDGTLDGLGPFAIARVVRGEVDLEPATGGALPRPSRGVALRVVHDENARALRLEAGRADVALNLVSPTLLPAMAEQPDLAVASRPGANLTYMVVEEEHPPLDDPRFRRALSMAIDRATLCASLLDGRASPAGDLIAPASWAHAGSPPLSFDPAASREVFTASSRAREVGGPPRRLTLLTSTERLRGDIARFIAQELGDAGLPVDVVPLELGTLIARLNAGDFDLAILQLPEMSEPNVLRRFLHGAFVPPTGANRGRVHDAALDDLLDQGDRVADPAARLIIYARLEAVEREAMHLVPLWYEDQVVVTSARARAFKPSAEGRWLDLAALP
ncbi:MAG TPA: ABC transporter substrate-binding protein [Polyangiaceae bacterium]|nr:ABC transporter substrate-binding protein [Polyangiaceae bacterium]